MPVEEHDPVLQHVLGAQDAVTMASVMIMPVVYLGSSLGFETKLTTFFLCLDKTLGVFHYRPSKEVYKLNYTMAQEACKEAGGTIATYTQLLYAQQVLLLK